MNRSVARGAPPRFWPGLAAGLAICALTVLAYVPALHGGFIWNDADYVTRAALRSAHGLFRIWFEVGATEQYYPLLHSVFWIEHRLWGNVAMGYHWANVLQHAASACLFALILRRLLGRPSAAILGGLLFALHPVAVESVAWISEQKNTLSTLCYLASALAYLRWREAQPGSSRNGGIRPTSYYVLATVLFVAAVLSKTVTATLPAALLVVVWWQSGRLSWKTDVRPLAPWLVFGAGAGLFSAWVEHTVIGAEGAAFDLNLIQRCVLAGRVFWFYLGKLLWPADLIFIYPRWKLSGGLGWQSLYLLAAVGAFAVLLRSARIRRAPLAAGLFFAGTLFPVLGFFNVYAFIYSYVADHWQYLASLGVIALAAGGWAQWEARGRGARLAAVALLGVLFMLTWRQSRMYTDIETFYRTTLRKNPDCWMAHNNLGTLLQHRQATAPAIAEYRAALRIDPGLAEVHFNLGNSLADSGHPAEALAQYQEALRLKPVFPEAYYTLGALAARAGNWAEAIADLEHALRLRANFPEARTNLAVLLNNWGNQLLGEGKPAEAMPHFVSATRLDPTYPEPVYNLGVALAQSGRSSEAIAEYERALHLRPNYPEAENNLGAALALAGRNREAIAHYERALSLRPDYPEARYNLGLARQAAVR